MPRAKSTNSRPRRTPFPVLSSRENSRDAEPLPFFHLISHSIAAPDVLWIDLALFNLSLSRWTQLSITDKGSETKGVTPGSFCPAACKLKVSFPNMLFSWDNHGCCRICCAVGRRLGSKASMPWRRSAALRETQLGTLHWQSTVAHPGPA